MAIDNGTTVKTLKFYYDATGSPFCFDLDGEIYFYITNLQGDVVALADQYGEVVRYEYDAWGKPISTYYVASPYYDAMQYNPLRYRGYIYDNETGFYYLQSRYYDPIIGRFINSDGVMSGAGGDIRGYNLFAYCFNNPVNQSDSSGNWPRWIEMAKEWVDNNVLTPVVEFVPKAIEVIPTKEFVSQIDDFVKSNVTASAGICIGMGLQTEVSDVVGIEFISRMDLIGVQLRNGELEIGHNGKSAFNVSLSNFTFGPQSETFEDFNTLDRSVYEDSYFDASSSYGCAAAFVIGYHYNVSISYWGILKSAVSFINDTYEEQQK